ncbi:ABC transporter substrate-binding protein [Saccharobesus litoralis]|nr:extracellular solute-binding protein [Saccharobesus litoralis]
MFRCDLCLASSLSPKTHIHSATEVLEVLVDDGANNRPALQNVFYDFQAASGIKIKVSAYAALDDFRNERIGYSLIRNNGADIIFTHSAGRLMAKVNKGLVTDITSLWDELNLQQAIHSQLLPHVSLNNRYFALPYKFTTWGLFYHQNLTTQFGPVPQTWPEFVEYCIKLKNHGWHVFPSNSKQPWVATSWFEHIILRTQGADLLYQIASGEKSFYDSDVRQAFVKWKELIDHDLFSYGWYEERWEKTLPLLLRKKLAFIFSGSSYMVNNAQKFENGHKIKRVSFPKIADIPRYESAPVEAFFINARSKKQKLAKQFIKYLANKDVQTSIAQKLHAIPAHKHAQLGENPILKQDIDAFKTSVAVTPFFDRLAEPKFEKYVQPLLVEFLKNGDIDKTLHDLEQVRLRFYPFTKPNN